MGEYVRPAAAFRKLDAARLLKQGVYIYGSSGFGKTELIKQYLKNQKYIYIPCTQDNCDLSMIPENCTDPVAIDNVNAIQSTELRGDIISLFSRLHCWIIVSGRSRMPSWLFDTFIRRSMMLITEEDIALTRSDIDKYMRSSGLILSEKELSYLYKCSYGNLIGVKYTEQCMLSGAALDEELYQKNIVIVMRYFEETIVGALNTEVTEMLLKVSIPDDFTQQLAVMLTGNTGISRVIELAMDSGNFMTKSGDVYTIRAEFLGTLRNKALKEYPLEEIKQYALLAGAYYESNNEDNKALELYARYGSSSRIKELLLRNSRKNAESGYYIEMKKYYLMLSENDIASSVYLMSAMSLLYSMMMDFEKSEYWYERLAQYRDASTGAKKREAIAQIAYLDITLPGRGSKNILEIIRSCYTLLKDRSIPVPEFSLTSNLPSIMNGGKDFCDWSRRDKEIAAFAGKLICNFLGKYGVGLVNAALAESYFEKGGDPYEILAMSTSAKLEAEAGGKLELRFAATAVMIRQHLILGNPDAARDLLNSFERTVKAEKMRKLQPSIDAMRCRIALMDGEAGIVEKWLSGAPDENEGFIALDRYQYLTKIRCYIRYEELAKAYSLITSMKLYAEKCDRKFISMEVSLLEAIVKFRRDADWKEEFIKTLARICEYDFVPIISREGAALFPLLKECRSECAADRRINAKWFEKVLTETGRVARRYPLYLKTDAISAAEISPIDIRILSCLADGLSVQKTSEVLGIKFETLRSRIKELYRKLNVKNKTEAVIMAREMKLI